MTALVRRKANVLASVMDEPIFPVQRPVTIKASTHPEMELARQHLASLSPERRQQLNEGNG